MEGALSPITWNEAREAGSGRERGSAKGCFLAKSGCVWIPQGVLECELHHSGYLPTDKRQSHQAPSSGSAKGRYRNMVGGVGVGASEAALASPGAEAGEGFQVGHPQYLLHTFTINARQMS